MLYKSELRSEQSTGSESDEGVDPDQSRTLLAKNIGVSSTHRRSGASQRSSGCVCRYRWVNRKALLVLVWNLLVFSYQYQALDGILKLIRSFEKWEPWEKMSVTIALQVSLPFLLYPFAGWLADTKLGRYRVMKGSIWIMWLGSIVLLSDLLLQYYFTYTHYSEKALGFLSVPVGIVVYGVNVIGLAGFHANVIPFGIDQMENGSADQYSSFVHWYYWSRNFSLGFVVTLILRSSLSCYTSIENAEHSDRINLIIVVCEVGFLSLSLLLDFFFSDILIKEPKTQNPLRTVTQVTFFMAKHNHPVGQRSAMTYGQGYSRSDLATSPYGGPYDVEEVESVKTFWYMIVFLAAVSVSAIPTVTVNNAVEYLIGPHINLRTHCSLNYLVINATNPLVFIIALPVYELVMYPLIHKYILPMTNRIGIGILLAILALVASLVIAVVIRKTNNECLFYHSNDLIELDVWVFVLPLLLSSFGEMLIFIPAYEFVCAQSPYNMRGLLIGLLYALGGIANGLACLIVLIFGGARLKSSENIFSCSFWFNFVILFVAVVGFGSYLGIVRWYRKRQRGYVGREFVNQQALLEAYYDTLRDTRNS